MFGDDLTMNGETASVSDVFPSAGKLSTSRIFTTANGEGLKWKDKSKLHYCVPLNDGSPIATYNHKKLSSAFTGKKATLDISPNATHLTDILVVTWVIAAKKSQDRSSAAAASSSSASSAVASGGGC
ncbi:hypothetical protein RHS01_00360 [Rhizoctonia solani]|uniref:DUF6593 domain-containing protein n=1 Tax=Rhizoctonia solani TaxID=456999 RepID=A0A8H7ILI0_9AGAM|nr:hypothetical protein RHS01_00360 [Rhizoctonia solani]